VANAFVFDVMEGVGAFAAELVDAIEKARLDGEAGLGARALDGRQGGLRRVEDNAAEAALDLAELTFPRNCAWIHHATMRNSASTKDLWGGLVGLGQTCSKSSLNAASAMMRRTSEKAKLVRPFTLCRRCGFGRKRAA
jgi:hypothetical protein